MQSAPILMLSGKRTQFSADASQTRRSVVAIDKQGRLLFIVSPGQVFSLDELADQLTSSDLSIEVALNLDGGPEATLSLRDEALDQAIGTLGVGLPMVLLVVAK